MWQNVMVMLGAYLRGRMNERMANVHHATKKKQAHPIYSVPPS
jgi:hypothetical protein